MKKVLIIILLTAIVSCTTNPSRTDTDFKHEGEKVGFFTQDSIITDFTIKRIKTSIFSRTKSDCKYPDSFIPVNLLISRVDSLTVGDYKESFPLYFNEKEIVFMVS